MRKIKQKIRFWNLIFLAIPPKGNEIFWNMPRKFEMKNMKLFIFEIWNERKWKLSFLKWKFPFEKLKKMAISLEGNEKNWNEEIIYFVYATEIKVPIIPL
jgi:hypothetical protein